MTLRKLGGRTGFVAGVAGLLLCGANVPAAGAAGTVGLLLGVSCASTTACSAVGESDAGAALAEQWDGSSWSVQPVPTPAGTTLSDLHDVSCASVGACTSVGQNYTSSGVGDFVVRWDGTAWTPETTLSTQNATTVACTSSTTCVAITNQGGGTEILDGISWTLIPPPSAFPVGLSCVSSANCTAVESNSAQDLVIQRWNGSSWINEKAAVPTQFPFFVCTGPALPPACAAEGESDALGGVSCPSATVCIAVGTRDITFVEDDQFQEAQVPLIERWNGKAWSIDQVSTEGSLASVSCKSASACIAVGSIASANPAVIHTTFAMRWNGLTWSKQSMPQISNVFESELFGVSCPSTQVCTAVGDYETQQSNPTVALTLAERWVNVSGWSIQSS
jgi:hypothetical protein